MAATLALKNAILALIQTGHYVGLISAVADESAGSVTEVSVASYARQAITWTTPSAGAMSNSADILFPATAGSGTYTHVGIWSASTAGTLKHVFALGSTRIYDATNQPKIPAGELDYDANRTT